MVDVAAVETLRSVRDFTEEEFQTELKRVLAATAIERQWLAATGARPFANDTEIRRAVLNGHLTRIAAGTGFVVIRMLFNWTPDQSSPQHEYHYSPPYLRPEAAVVLSIIGNQWKERFDGSEDFTLPVTSLVRSVFYQEETLTKGNKLAVPRSVGDSSHLYGWAFDIDGCGLYRQSQMQTYEPIHPRLPEKFQQYRASIEASREVLHDALHEMQQQGFMNVVEELPGTQEHCFHVCTNPLAFSR